MPVCCAIALDVGGSSIKSGMVTFENHTVSGFRTDPIDSYGTGEEILANLADVIRAQITQTGSIPISGEAPGTGGEAPSTWGEAPSTWGVGLGFPGPFDYAGGICLMQGISPRDGPGSRGKYDGIYGLDLRSALRRRLDQPGLAIEFRNDAEAAIVGEANFGAGHGSHRLIGVTLGTGMGSAFLSDGKRLTGGPGVPQDGWLFREPFAGRQADDIFSTRGLLLRLAQTGEHFSTVAQAAEAGRGGQKTALRAFREFGAELGIFLRPFILAFSAESVVVLGGIAQAHDLFGPSLIRELPVPVLTGTLGAKAALLGAVEGLELKNGLST